MNAFHLDPLGGMAGDMFAAALLDLRPELEPGLHDLIARCPLLDGVAATLTPHDDGVLTGRRFTVTNDNAPKDHPPHHHHHAHDGHHHHDDSPHSHVEWRSIWHALDHMPAPTAVIGHAIGIFSELAAAEARVHGTTPEAVTFHEVGAWDSIADILAAAYLIDAVGPAEWMVGSIPLGSGRVRTAHGLLPVPAPATVLLLEGFPMIDDGVAGERVTPTGAAILRYLCKGGPGAARSGRLAGSGHGFGMRRLTGVSNCLRVLAFERGEHIQADRVAVLECEIDDQTGEDLAIALAHIRAHAGVLDAVQAVAFGKKGRLMTQLRVLSVPHAADEVARLIFDETATLGIRRTVTERLTLPRRSHEAQAGVRTLPAKTAARPSGETTKLEADALSAVPGRAARERLRREAEGGNQ